jgi:hypothetical protein
VNGKDLEKDIAHEEGSDLGRLFRSLANADRSTEIEVQHKLTKEDAEELYMVFHVL